MNYKRIVISILDSLGASKSYTGYDYVVYGIQLMLEDKECVTCITKSLYLDIARHYNTTWNCVEKNIRTVVNAIWDSGNAELREKVFGRSKKKKRPTNKEFFKYLYDYITELENHVEMPGLQISMICPISNRYCESLSVFYTKILESAGRAG